MGKGARRNVKRFRGGLVFKAHRPLHHLTLGWRVIKKKKKEEEGKRGARCQCCVSGTAAERRGDNFKDFLRTFSLKVLKTFPLKLRPEYGLDCLMCAEFARQRGGLIACPRFESTMATGVRFWAGPARPKGPFSLSLSLSLSHTHTHSLSLSLFLALSLACSLFLSPPSPPPLTSGGGCCSSRHSAVRSARRGNNLKRFTVKPRPESGRGCLTCALFARPLHRNVLWYRGGLVFGAHRLLYHSA